MPKRPASPSKASSLTATFSGDPQSTNLSAFEIHRHLILLHPADAFSAGWPFPCRTRVSPNPCRSNGSASQRTRVLRRDLREVNSSKSTPCSRLRTVRPDPFWAAAQGRADDCFEGIDICLYLFECHGVGGPPAAAAANAARLCRTMGAGATNTVCGACPRFAVVTSQPVGFSGCVRSLISTHPVEP